MTEELLRRDAGDATKSGYVAASSHPFRKGAAVTGLTRRVLTAV